MVRPMTAVKPMLAEPCRSVDQAFTKCPNGMFAEIKYDGERVQLHKKGSSMKYLSRNLKPVTPHKVKHLPQYIEKAFPEADTLILDGEVLLMDNKTNRPLPFGTLGVHKMATIKDANLCLFVFDCLYYNGEDLVKKPISERRKLLEEKMTEIPNWLMLSEMKRIEPDDVDNLTDVMEKTFSDGREGLVLKDLMSVYEPGKRSWLKVKKDYLAEGTMADSADLVVIGAYYGTGKNAFTKSRFLMGVFDKKTNKWCTVTKCGNGLNDKMLKDIEKQLEFVKIDQDPDSVPDWLNIDRTVVPDFVIKDPKKSQVWEIIGAEFWPSKKHTADGISIRFPRLQKVRDDKSVEDATDLAELKKLFVTSKQASNIPKQIEKLKTDHNRAHAAAAAQDGNEQDNDDESDENDEDVPSNTKALSSKLLGKRGQKPIKNEASPSPPKKGKNK